MQRSIDRFDALVYKGEAFELEPGDGAWVPVERVRSESAQPDSKMAEVVLQAEGASVDVAPGLWSTGAGPWEAPEAGRVSKGRSETWRFLGHHTLPPCAIRAYAADTEPLCARHVRERREGPRCWGARRAAAILRRCV